MFTHRQPSSYMEIPFPVVVPFLNELATYMGKFTIPVYVYNVFTL